MVAIAMMEPTLLKVSRPMADKVRAIAAFGPMPCVAFLASIISSIPLLPVAAGLPRLHHGICHGAGKASVNSVQYGCVALCAQLLLSACALTYSMPKTVMPETSQQIPGSSQTLFAIAMRVVEQEGLEIAETDASAGQISTSRTLTPLTPETADCGTTFGIDYLSDVRTSPRLGYDVMVSTNRVSVSTVITATYNSGCTVDFAIDCSETNMVLTCVSRGILEAQLLSKIASAASTK